MHVTLEACNPRAGLRDDPPSGSTAPDTRGSAQGDAPTSQPARHRPDL